MEEMSNEKALIEMEISPVNDMRAGNDIQPDCLQPELRRLVRSKVKVH
jgi:hypothetical protein